MEIKEIEIQSDDLKGTENFYSKVLGFKLFKNKRNLISFLCGDSLLTFVNSYQNKPKYHFAFNIPNNKIEEAKLWLASKVELILNEKDELISNFESWNAKSVYFYDNNDNIVEFIVRYDLINETEKKFDASSILSISEIGIVSEEPKKLVRQFKKKYNLNFFDKGIQTQEFMSFGNDNGLIIIVKKDRVWYPTQNKAEYHYARINIVSNDEKIEIIV